jgi:hypothetical protein
LLDVEEKQERFEDEHFKTSKNEDNNGSNADCEKQLFDVLS